MEPGGFTLISGCEFESQAYTTMGVYMLIIEPLFWSRTRLKQAGHPRIRTDTFKPDQFETVEIASVLPAFGFLIKGCELKTRLMQNENQALCCELET